MCVCVCAGVSVFVVKGAVSAWCKGLKEKSPWLGSPYFDTYQFTTVTVQCPAHGMSLSNPPPIMLFPDHLGPHLLWYW